VTSSRFRPRFEDFAQCMTFSKIKLFLDEEDASSYVNPNFKFKYFIPPTTMVISTHLSFMKWVLEIATHNCMIIHLA
jgi:hypothetical protein